MWFGTWSGVSILDFSLDPIPDPNFEQALIDLGIDKNGLTGDILRSEAEAATFIDITDAGVSDLTGIEAFINIESVQGDRNNIVTVDISNNTKLKQFHLNQNSLTSIDFSNNLLLEGVDLYSNNLTIIDLSLQTNLTAVAFGGNPLLEHLNVRNGNNINVTEFLVFDLPKINCIIADDSISQVMIDSGKTFSPDYTDVVLIPDVNFEQALIDIGIDRNGFSGDILRSDAEAATELNVSNPLFTSDDRYDNDLIVNVTEKITDLTGIDAFINITKLSCWGGELSSLDLSNNPLLKIVELVDNQISSINLSQNTELTLLWLETNALTEVDISTNTKLENIAFGYNSLTELDVSSNTELWVITSEGNQLSTIDVSNNAILEQLWVFDNPPLAQLDVTQNPLLFRIGIWNTSITTLDLSNNPITGLWAANNPLLEHLDMRNGNNPNVTTFWLDNTLNLTCINTDGIGVPDISQIMIDSSKTFSEDCGDFVYIPDPNFEQSLIDIGIDSDGVVNTSILREDAEDSLLTSLNLNNPKFTSENYGFNNDLIQNVTGKIVDLTGIEAFINLINLQISYSDITMINVDSNV